MSIEEFIFQDAKSFYNQHSLCHNLCQCVSRLNLLYVSTVFDFYAGPSARGRQLYCRACNFKNVSALLAGNFYTSYIDPNRLPLLRDTGTTIFYSKDIHLVMIQTTTRERCQNCIYKTRDVKTVSTELEMSKFYQLFPQRK